MENCLVGFNGCIFAYGQTGSGKTYTMLGGGDAAAAAPLAGESRGLIQRAFEHLFMRIGEKQEEAAAVGGRAWRGRGQEEGRRRMLDAWAGGGRESVRPRPSVGKRAGSPSSRLRWGSPACRV